MLGFGDKPEDWNMHTWASATLPDDDAPEMKGYVRGSQLDKDKQTTWQIYSGPSRWDAKENTYRLHHNQTDHAEGLRGYVPTVMEAFRCHQDLQFDSSGGSFRAYLVKYVPKFSDAATDELLDDDAEMNGDETAAAILTKYRPMEPEMVLQLHASHFRQWRVGTVSGGVREIQVPWPGKCNVSDDVKATVHAYETSSWRDERMPFIEFLRKTDDSGDGKIALWLRRRHEEDTITKGYAFHQKHGGLGSLRKYTEDCKRLLKAEEIGSIAIDGIVRRRMQASANPTSQEPDFRKIQNFPKIPRAGGCAL